MALSINSLSFEDRLLALAVIKQDCLIRWFMDASFRFAPKNPSLSQKMEELAMIAEGEREKLRELQNDSFLPLEFQELYDEFEGRFEGEKHYFVMDEAMGRRLLNSLWIVISDLEIFYSQCVDQTGDLAHKSLYQEIKRELFAKQHFIRKALEGQKKRHPRPVFSGYSSREFYRAMDYQI